MKKITVKSAKFVFVLAAFLFSASSAIAQTDKGVELKISERTEILKASYGDVPPTYSCSKPKLKYEKLICDSGYLTSLEKLYRMASVYAYENAIKTETDHKTFKNWYRGIKKRNSLSSAKAVENYFIEHINNALGGESPFYK